MACFNFILFFFVFFILNEKSATVSSKLPTDAIDQTCKTCANESPTFSYNFCLASLESVPVSRATNLQGLALISIALALENATNTISTINKLLDDETSCGFALEDCLQMYTDSVTMLVEAVEAFFRGKYGDARVRMSSVMDATSVCEDGFMENKSPLATENKNLFQLCDITVCIVNLLSFSLNS